MSATEDPLPRQVVLIVTIVNLKVFDEALVTHEGGAASIWAQRTVPHVVAPGLPTDCLDQQRGVLLAKAINGYLAPLIEDSLNLGIGRVVAIFHTFWGPGRDPATAVISGFENKRCIQFVISPTYFCSDFFSW